LSGTRKRGAYSRRDIEVRVSPCPLVAGRFFRCSRYVLGESLFLLLRLGSNGLSETSRTSSKPAPSAFTQMLRPDSTRRYTSGLPQSRAYSTRNSTTLPPHGLPNGLTAPVKCADGLLGPRGSPRTLLEAAQYPVVVVKLLADEFDRAAPLPRFLEFNLLPGEEVVEGVPQMRGFRPSLGLD